LKEKVMPRSKVSAVRTPKNPSGKEIEGAIRKAIDLIGGLDDIISRKDLVLINPSWVAPPTDPQSAVITSPEVTKTIADIIRDFGGRPVIAESSAVGVDTEKVITNSGYGDLRREGYEVIDLKSTPKVKVGIKGGEVLKEVETFELVTRANTIISVPKMKTHDQTEITCSLKKLKGLVTDEQKRRMHRVGVFKGVVDINMLFKPRLSVVDAVLCQEGLGPIFGRPVEMNLIVAGKDLVAVDSICGQIMGYEPKEVLITKCAANRGLGVMDNEMMELVGEPLENVKRRFMRSVEDDPVEVDGFSLLFGGITCTGCRNTIMSALVDMRNAGQLKYLPGVTVITGNPPIEKALLKDAIVAVGQCVPPEKRGERFVKGCPPNNAYVVDAIIGGREKVRRMYAEESLEETEK
jgi:uncharacterized protein (DUF362 family)